MPWNACCGGAVVVESLSSPPISRAPRRCCQPDHAIAVAVGARGQAETVLGVGKVAGQRIVALAEALEGGLVVG